MKIIHEDSKEIHSQMTISLLQEYEGIDFENLDTLLEAEITKRILIKQDELVKQNKLLNDIGKYQAGDNSIQEWA